MAIKPGDMEQEKGAGGILIKMTVHPSMGDVFEHLSSLPARARYREALYLLRVGFDFRLVAGQHLAAAMPSAAMSAHNPTSRPGMSTPAMTNLRASDNENVTMLYGEDLTSFLEPHS